MNKKHNLIVDHIVSNDFKKIEIWKDKKLILSYTGFITAYGYNPDYKYFTLSDNKCFGYNIYLDEICYITAMANDNYVSIIPFNEEKNFQSGIQIKLFIELS